MSNGLDVTARGISNSVQEVKHTKAFRSVKILKVENNGASVKKEIRNIGNLLIALGVSYLKLKISVAGDSGTAFCGLLGSYADRRSSALFLILLEFNFLFFAVS